MKLLRSTYRFREMRRFGTITRVLVKHGFGDLVDRRGGGRGKNPRESLKRSPWPGLVFPRRGGFGWSLRSWARAS